MPDYIKAVSAKGRTYFYFRPPLMAGIDAKMVPLGTNQDVAAIRGQRLFNQWRTRYGQPRRRRAETPPDAAVWKAALEALEGARKRAIERSLEFDIDERHVSELLRQQGMRCAVSGLPFVLYRPDVERVSREPYRPSIDRINSRRGYLKDNCRLVCTAVNVALGEWGDEVFLRIACAAAKHMQQGNGTNSDRAGLRRSFP